MFFQLRQLISQLNLYENELSYQLTIENQCGDIVSATSSNSKVSVTRSGLVSTTSNAVSYGETLTATLTFTTEGGCTSTVTVKVKNINETPPTVNISISGSTYSSGYKSGAKVTVTCESDEGISSFTAKDNTGDTGTLTVNETNRKQRVITLSSASSSRKVSVSCTSNNGMTTSDSRTYRIYVYSKSSACGVDYYNYKGGYTCCNSSGSACDTYYLYSILDTLIMHILTVEIWDTLVQQVVLVQDQPFMILVGIHRRKE